MTDAIPSPNAKTTADIVARTLQGMPGYRGAQGFELYHQARFAEWCRDVTVEDLEAMLEARRERTAGEPRRKA